MGRLIFDLSDEEREALERLRVRFGLRSHADTLRRLIRDADGSRSAELPWTENSAAVLLAQARKDKAEAAKQESWATPEELKHAREIIPTIGVPLAGTFERKPYQKGKKT